METVQVKPDTAVKGVARPRAATWVFAASALAGCGVDSVPTPTDTGTVVLDAAVAEVDAGDSVNSVDLLFEIDNSNSMAGNQSQLAAQFSVLIDQFVNPPTDPTTHAPLYPPVANMHVGVISQDLGTPGSRVPSCANSDLGDDGRLNPIRNGLSEQQHEPWNTLPANSRPARCMANDPNQYPSYLTFDASQIGPAHPTYQSDFRDDFVCNALLYANGCGLEAQIEAAYRALVIHNPRDVPGNTDPNAGFLRNLSVLAIVIVSDEEDGSVRDCRFAESDAHGSPLPCHDATSVYDEGSPNWSSNDLNLRFYMYTPGGPQDPTWTLDRYIDPSNTNRGFLGLKPGHPDRVIFGAITGVPLTLPRVARGEVDWNTLLGTHSDGSDGMVGTTVGGPISMKQANADPGCPTRVVPSCYREGTVANPAMPTCDPGTQYFAWPSRRIAQLARIFDDNYHNGTVSSICQGDYSSALTQIVQRIQRHF